MSLYGLCVKNTYSLCFTICRVMSYVVNPSTIPKLSKKMTKPTYLLFFTTILLLISCTADKASPPNTQIKTPKPNNSKSNNAILIFKQEKQMEIWNNGKKEKSLQIDIDQRYPIGIFEAQVIDKGIRLNFPNEFYQGKNYRIEFEPKIGIENLFLKETDISATPVYVFPNDARKGQPFVANFSSPHWMAGLYAKMNLYLLEYK